MASTAQSAFNTQAVAVEQSPLVGMPLGYITRRFGLMSSEETVSVTDVIATSGDLAVTDRLAFVAAVERHLSLVVIEFDGWFIACQTSRELDEAQIMELRPALGCADTGTTPRILSVVTARGIMPALGALSR